MGQDSIGSTASHYGRDSPGIEFQCLWDVLYLSRLALEPIHLPVQWLSFFCPVPRRQGLSITSPI